MNSRRRMLQLGACMLSGALTGANAAPVAARNASQTSRRGKVVGPIAGGRHGWPFGPYAGDISRRGYIEEEYFISGEARRHQAVGLPAADGRWTFEPFGAAAPFKT